MKTILITGGSSGIGKAIGDYLFHKGYTVYGTSRNPDLVTNSLFPLLSMDVREPESIRQAVAKILSVSGKIDVLINNAGIGIMGPLEEIPTSEMLNQFHTNLFGPVEVIKAVLPGMRAQNSGLILNITSIAGYMGLPYRALYSASKGALGLLSEALRIELKPFNIQVAHVAPGDFATNIAAGRYHAPTATSAYPNYATTLESMNAHVNNGADPEEMARAIYKIIKQPNPKVTYTVGAFMQRFSIFLKKLLPGKMYEKMLMKHYGL